MPCPTCGNCDAEAWGFSQSELTKKGWSFHEIPDRKDPFALCVERFAKRRAMAKAISTAVLAE